MNLEKAEEYVLGQLRLRLPETLYYHGLHHVQDVTNAALYLAGQEGITDGECIQLLRTAALYHDSGFMNTYQLHEEEGCRIVRQMLPDFGYTESQIEIICGMIMATRIPQQPQNQLEKILCDADLDYLGRDDFEPIAATLYEELKFRNLVSDVQSWNKIQIQFLSSHHYWTDSARKLRNCTKAKHLDQLVKSS